MVTRKVMRIKLFIEQVLPFVLWFVLLVILSRVSDAILHALGYGDIGEYLGILGVGLILISFIYSIRKVKVFKAGSLRGFLTFHEWAAWLGAYFILIHGGIHLHAILPWAAILLMLISVVSGFTGHILHKRVKKSIEHEKSKLIKEGVSEQEAENQIFRAATMAKSMLKWRAVHRPLTALFAGLAIMHIISSLFYATWWGPK